VEDRTDATRDADFSMINPFDSTDRERWISLRSIESSDAGLAASSHRACRCKGANCDQDPAKKEGIPF
jgi:hypothetical protein